MRRFAATIYTRGTALAVAFMAATLFGCSGMAHLDPEAEPTQEELLRGSWHITVPWTDGDEELGVEYHILTFTKDRWIQHRDRRDLDGQEVASWARSGTWSIADGTITRTWYESPTTAPCGTSTRTTASRTTCSSWTAGHPASR